MSRNITSSELSKQDEYFLTNIKNMINYASYVGKSKHSSFLDERQRQLAMKLLRSSGCNNYSFYGGANECTRSMLGIFPDDENITYTSYPITILKIDYSSKATISHSDILGAIMGLQIERDCVGDIIIAETYAIIFVTENISDFLLLNLNKVGKYNVSVTISTDDNITIEHKFQEIKGSVASLRLDCIVAFLIKSSRTIALEKIISKCVKLNCFDTIQPAQKVTPGDTIVIRGYGKFIVGNDVTLTKKARLFLTAKKYI